MNYDCDIQCKTGSFGALLQRQRQARYWDHWANGDPIEVGWLRLAHTRKVMPNGARGAESESTTSLTHPSLSNNYSFS
jgi:hypothetical protein